MNPEPVQRTGEATALAADACHRLFRLIGATLRESCVVRFETAPDEPLVLPAAAVRLLGAVLTELAKGNAVTVMPHHAELTTQEAADLLTHRRVRFADLGMTYKRRRDAESETALRELAGLPEGLQRVRTP